MYRHWARSARAIDPRFTLLLLLLSPCLRRPLRSTWPRSRSCHSSALRRPFHLLPLPLLPLPLSFSASTFSRRGLHRPSPRRSASAGLQTESARSKRPLSLNPTAKSFIPSFETGAAPAVAASAPPPPCPPPPRPRPRPPLPLPRPHRRLLRPSPRLPPPPPLLRPSWIRCRCCRVCPLLPCVAPPPPRRRRFGSRSRPRTRTTAASAGADTTGLARRTAAALRGTHRTALAVAVAAAAVRTAVGRCSAAAETRSRWARRTPRAGRWAAAPTVQCAVTREKSCCPSATCPSASCRCPTSTMAPATPSSSARPPLRSPHSTAAAPAVTTAITTSLAR